MAVLTTTNLTVHYGRHPALSELSVEIPEGVSGLLGQNGAGKSTLLKTVLGFLEPTGGAIEVLGATLSGASGRPHALRQRLGYFPERSVFLPGLTSVEMVALAGEIGGLRRTDALARAHDVLWFTGLGEARYRLVEEFSTGMKQRTKLAMSMVHDPDLVLLDEPTSGLDPAGRRQMLELVRDIGKRRVSVILSTHILHDVEQICENVIALDKGKLALEGRLAALRRHPGWVYEVRVREDSPGAFRDELSTRGLPLEEDSHGQLRITLSPGDASAEPSTRFLFEAARLVGAEIRHLRRFETSLEDEFLTAVDSNPHHPS
jgi:ABC-2 type transport system ATP-binding protein